MSYVELSRPPMQAERTVRCYEVMSVLGHCTLVL